MPRPPLPPRAGAFVNLTPMIDIVFQLIIFFMVVARFSSQQTIELELPLIDDRRTEPLEAENRAVINIIPLARTEAEGGAYRLGLLSYPETPEGINELAASLREIRERQPTVEVLIRADRVESYSRVHPAVQAVTLSGIRRVHLVTIPLEGESP